MSESLSKEILCDLSDKLASRLGLFFPIQRHQDLLRGIRSAAAELGFDSLERCSEWLLSRPWTLAQTDALARSLTVGETYFFRHKDDFTYLETVVFPELIAKRRDSGRSLRIWSVASSSGEEPYTIAMLLDGLIPDIERWKILIMGTDINPDALARAREGIYREWSLRETPSERVSRYFERISDDRFRVSEKISGMVRFSPLNLAYDPYPSSGNDTNCMDLIFCRNVMIYFSTDLSQRVIRNLHASLVEGGHLCVSPSEAPLIPLSIFDRAPMGGTRLFRKIERSRGATPGGRSFLDIDAPMERWSGARSMPEGPAPVLSNLGDGDRPGWLEERGWGAATLETGCCTEKNSRIPLERARALFENGRHDEAAEILTRLCNPECSDRGGACGGDEMVLLARIHADQGSLSQALEWCERAVQASTLNPDAHHLHATVLQELGRRTEAVEAFRRVIYLEPDDVMAHFCLANLLRLEKIFDEASRHLENVLELLSGFSQDEILSESEGMTAGRLRSIVEGMISR